MKIAILNYNIGNLSSVKNAFLKLGADCEILSNADMIKHFDKLVLPGVGAFGDAIEHLNNNNMSDAIRDYVKSGKYMLGICLGMQLLFDKSYEFGEYAGLGLISGEVVKFRDSSLKVPHIGWNKLDILKECLLLKGINNEAYLYFVHSFYVKAKNKENVVATCDYIDSFASVVQKDNIFGIQPHPEKSSAIGLRILKNFMEL